MRLSSQRWGSRAGARSTRAICKACWSLLPVPAAFFVYLLLSRRAREIGASSAEARFVRAWALLFSAETLLDPLVGGKLVAWLGVPEWLATAVMLGFVLLGDFRVYWLLFAVALRDVGRGAQARGRRRRRSSRCSPMRASTCANASLPTRRGSGCG